MPGSVFLESRGTAGPLGLLDERWNDSRAVGPGWVNEWPLGPEEFDRQLATAPTRSRFLGIGIEIANGSITPIDRWSDLGSSCSACSLPFQSASVPEGEGVAAKNCEVCREELARPCRFFGCD